MLIYTEDSNWTSMCLPWVTLTPSKPVSSCGTGGVAGGLSGWLPLLSSDVLQDTGLPANLDKDYNMSTTQLDSIPVDLYVHIFFYSSLSQYENHIVQSNYSLSKLRTRETKHLTTNCKILIKNAARNYM